MHSLFKYTVAFAEAAFKAEQWQFAHTHKMFHYKRESPLEIFKIKK